MRKFGILIFLVLCMIFSFACVDLDGSGSTVGSGSDNSKPALLTFSDDVYDALRLPCTPEEASNDDQDITFNIIMDSRIASSSGSSGYLKKSCYTFSQILACLKTSIAGEKFEGYYTGYDVKQQFNSDTQTNTVIIASNYIKTSDFFANAVSASFPNTDMLPAEAIEQIAKDAKRDNVYIFITDMAMPESSESYRIIEALSDNIVSNNDLTIGLIGVQADYVGTIYNIPISHFGINLPENESYKKPVYLLYIGEKKAVFKAMDNFLFASENNSSLNSPGQTNALYYYKYSCMPNSNVKASEQQIPSVSFSGCLASYMKQNEIKENEIYNIISLNSEESGYKSFLEHTPFFRIYTGATKDEYIAKEENNVEIAFTIPFEIISDTGDARSKLLKPGRSPKFSDTSLSLDSNVSSVLLRPTEGAEELKISSTESASSSVFDLHRSKASFDLDNVKVRVLGDMNVSNLKQDEPVLYLVRMAVDCDLPSDILKEAYDLTWLSNWQMDLNQLQKEWGRESAVKLALKTPYIADIFGQTLLDANITFVQQSISKNSAQYAQGINFGFVLREQAKYYVRQTELENNDDLGWAFSRDDVKELLSR